MKTNEIRSLFLDYFAENEHQIVSSSPLVPGNDPTLLFTNAGMVQFKDVFLGMEKRDYNRAVTSQRCVRAGGKHNDLENVGYTARHHTFFEMLGNFSFGDYFKENAIKYAYRFLTEKLGFEKEKLWITVYLDDDEAESIWKDIIGIPADRIVRKDEKDNFWQMGDVGPCGPCTEIFYDHGPEVEGGPPGTPEEDGDRYIEIWNLVFMQYNRQEDGSLEPLPKPSVDTGMGLERLAAVLQHVHSNYEIDLFVNLIAAAAKATGAKDLSNKSLHVIADHIRSTSFLIIDGVLPSNEGRGYVLRRIIRRAIRHGYRLGCKEPFFHKITQALAKEMGEAYPELVEKKDRVAEVLLLEEQRFALTIENGLGLLDEEIKHVKKDNRSKKIGGDVAFKLYDTYGFPLDLTQDVAREHDLEVDIESFDVHMEAQRERARQSSQFKASKNVRVDNVTPTAFMGYHYVETDAKVLALLREGEQTESLNEEDHGTVIVDNSPFYAESGGQIGDSGIIKSASCEFEVLDTQKQADGVWLHHGRVLKGSLSVDDEVAMQVAVGRRDNIKVHHSATHLLHAALKEVLGEHVAQRGSLVAENRLRFDFTHDKPMTRDERAQIEHWVNRYIRQNYAIDIAEMSIDKAKAKGATALFGEKYGDTVRVVTIGPESMELCGGIHVDQTGDIGQFLLLDEGGVASGVRRIEAVGGLEAENILIENQQRLLELGDILKARPEELVERSSGLMRRIKQLEKENQALKVKAIEGGGVSANIEKIGDIDARIERVVDIEPKVLRQMVDGIRKEMKKGIVVIVSEYDSRVALAVSVSDDYVANIKAGDMVKELSAILDGKGGGKADFAQGGGTNIAAIDQALDRARVMIKQQA